MSSEPLQEPSAPDAAPVFGAARQRPAGLAARVAARRCGRNTGAPAIYGEHRYLVWAVLVVLIALVVPRLFSTTPNQYLVDVWLVYALAGLGFYWIFGLAGRFAFCQTFMMALGGYLSDWITAHLGADWFVLSMVAAMAATALAALIIGVVLNRSTIFYFAIGTLAVTQVGNVVFNHTTSFSGPNGTVVDVPAPSLFGLTLNSYSQMFWFLLAILAAAALLGVLIERSPLRRDAIAARDNAEVARTIGVPVSRVQLVLFAVGSALGGLSGSLLGAVSGTTSTSSFGIQLAIGIFLMLLIGGVDSVWGPVVGAAFYVAIPQWLSGLAQYQGIVYGALLLVVIILFPQGIVGALRTLASHIRPGSRPSMPRPTIIDRLRPLLPLGRRQGGSGAP
jgi:branched-chain amino acid transport system permease protein